MKRVLVIQKTSLYGQLLSSPKAPDAERVFNKDGALQERYANAHADNENTMNLVHGALKRAGLEFEACARPDIPKTKDFDLVVTVGGDGTFLDASHAVTDIPVLGVNSSITSSIGHFCCSHVGNFEEILQDVLSGKKKPILRYRMQVELNGTPLPILALNEVLFTHQIPAGTTRYRIKVGNKEEAHKSSGVWISTFSGSTGAIMSAGGTKEPQPAKSLQYLVREPYVRGEQHFDLLQGYSDEPIEIYSTSGHGALFIDGPGERLDLEFGSKVVFRPGHAPLRAFIADSDNQ